MDVSTAVREAMAVSLDVWLALVHKLLVQLAHELGGREALSSSCVPLQDVLLLREVTHVLDDLVLLDAILHLCQEPAGVVLELGVRIAQEDRLERSSRIEAELDYGVDVAKDEPLSVAEVEASVELLGDETQPDELWKMVFVLPDHLVGFFFPSDGIVHQGGRDEHPPLPDQIRMHLDGPEIVDDDIILAKLDEDLLDVGA
jgi:hypothetical protein